MKRFLFLPLALCLVACTADQVTTTLEFAVDAAITAAAVAAPQDSAYLSLASSCLNAATTELATTDTNAQKATLILAACTSVAAGTAGLSPSAVAVANAVSAFLTNIKTLEAMQLSHPELVNAFAGSGKVKIDTRRLARIQKKLAKLKK